MSQIQPEDGEKRSSSPPGRESREDWRGGNQKPKLTSEETAVNNRERDRSRSPRGRRSRSPKHYGKDTNTTSNEPHLQRARLFVGNIEPDKVHRRDLIRLFSKHGEVLGVSVHKGYAFVQMDRERTANKAVNCEDNRMFMGSRIHVEFSQAALKAGAKLDRLAIQQNSPPPPAPLPPRDRSMPSIDHYSIEVERDHEERLSRILSMERELAYLRTREYHDPHRRPDVIPPERGDSYRGYSPPIPRDHGAPPHTRDVGMSRSDDRRGGYYERQSSPPPRSTSGGNPYRDSVSYPSYDRREGTSSSQYGASYPRSGSSPSVGYGGGSGTGSKSSGANAPPGWPGADYDKSSNATRAPFTNVSPWS